MARGNNGSGSGGLTSTGGKAQPDAEVLARPKRRVFTAQEKLKYLEEAERLAETGGLGEMLRREGLYSSYISTWRRERDLGQLTGLSPKKRGRKARVEQAREAEVSRLEREVERLKQRLAQAEAIIAVQKKLSTLLGVPLRSDEDEGREP